MLLIIILCKIAAVCSVPLDPLLFTPHPLRVLSLSHSHNTLSIPSSVSFSADSNSLWHLFVLCCVSMIILPYSWRPPSRPCGPSPSPAGISLSFSLPTSDGSGMVLDMLLGSWAFRIQISSWIEPHRREKRTLEMQRPRVTNEKITYSIVLYQQQQ